MFSWRPSRIHTLVIAAPPEPSCMTPFWSAKVGALRRLLLEALVIDVVGKEQPRRPLGDRRRLVVGGVGDAAPEAGDLVSTITVSDGEIRFLCHGN
jgi:hypothetical protein